MSIDESMEIDDDAQTTAPPRKRARKETKDLTTSSSKRSRKPNLFIPFRALGLITNHIPFVLQTRSFKGSTSGPRIHILTCLGRAWALWEGNKMTLLFVGPDAPEKETIRCMEMDGDAVWVAAGKWLVKYLRGKEVLRVEDPLGAAIGYIMVFGEVILGLTEDGRRLVGWNTSTGDVETSISFPTNFTALSILHPATYLNKVLISSSQGDLQLWNIKSSSLIHTFPLSRLLGKQTSNSGPNTCTITCMTQSPAIDVVGVGFSNGQISVYDIRSDELLMSMYMDSTGGGTGGIKAIGFRTDGNPILATASSQGHLALWDLNEGGKLLHLVRGAHEGAICEVKWVPGQPLLVTSGEDNCVKQWLFDSPTSPPRLLKFRSGHQAPPHLIRYYGNDGKQLLTASRDRSLRCLSVVRDSRSFELSQGSLQKKSSSSLSPLQSQKLAPITSISYSSARANDWDDIVTSHVDEVFARSWTLVGKRVGTGIFGAGLGEGSKKGKERNVTGSVKAVHVTSCGNFVLAGSSTGHIGMWNLQSGVKRRVFDVGPCPDEVANRGMSGSAGKKAAKERSITGLVTDPLNRNVVASTLDGTVNFFDFQTASLIHTLTLPSPCVSLHMHPDSGLIATVCDDMVVRVIDFETRRVVREFGGSRGRVLDVTFSPDSRWLLTTSLDSYISTYDIPTGLLIDKFKTASIATSLAFSPTNDFLATSHVDSVGVYLWANRAQFTSVEMSGIREDDEDMDMEGGGQEEGRMPTVQGVVEDEELEALESLTKEHQAMDVFSTPPQLDGELVTLTLLPRSRWQTLLNFEVIQRRNKPKEPPKAPEKAPFFLPTLPGVETRFAVDQQAEKEKKKKEESKRLNKATSELESVFYKKLVEDDRDGDYESFFTYAKSLSPAALDLEIRSLTTLSSLSTFMRALTQRLSTRQDFECVQAFESVFLQAHGDVIIENGDDVQLKEGLEKLNETHKREAERMVDLIGSVVGTLSFIRDV